MMNSLRESVGFLVGQGGPVVAVLLALSVVAVALVLLKLHQFWVERVGRHGPSREALHHWLHGRFADAEKALAGDRSAVSLALASAMRMEKARAPKPAIEEEVARIALVRLHGLQRGFRALDAIAQIAGLAVIGRRDVAWRRVVWRRDVDVRHVRRLAVEVRCVARPRVLADEVTGGCILVRRVAERIARRVRWPDDVVALEGVDANPDRRAGDRLGTSVSRGAIVVRLAFERFPARVERQLATRERKRCHDGAEKQRQALQRFHRRTVPRLSRSPS